MKLGTIIFIGLLCFAGYYVYINPELIDFVKDIDTNEILDKLNSPEAQEMADYLEANDLEKLRINSELIQFNTGTLDMDQAVYDVTIKANEVYGSSPRIEGHYYREQVLALTGDPNGDFELIDIRSPSFMVESDLMIFDVLVENIAISYTFASIGLQYLGPEEDFFVDYAAMCFIMIQDVPTLQKISITYDNCFRLTTTADNVLQLYDDGDVEEFLNNLDVWECDQ